ncbi:TrbG/VirB9 family P-type conjugative transfer protein [Paucibacter sp. PLA-PC-4]|uniref:TrbG/VirB9 family P-type conjugative transfer protein n=1 Tax=Paucibacter sp. PLA-PC-4 TaxID=2993655 RepID=UPI00224B6986|nr:TrbG/VirB9 family P-type conjugative transfer protein [Paucibacter sp. PLA-PC-4]MCX2865363.1 TrbG/VirB9 family P-type conjugative transfer protein [Paucibacter sp. PLA-PC-4]
MNAPHAAMSRTAVPSLLIAVLLGAGPAAGSTPAAATDPRLREIRYDPHRVVTVPVKRGQVTLVLLDTDESITELAAGLGGDCSKADSAWCIAAQPSGRTVFIKPKSTATAANNLAIVTSRRIHNLRFQVLPDDDPRPALYRLIVKAPPAGPPPAPRDREPNRMSSAERSHLVLSAIEASLQPHAPRAPSPAQLVSERLQAKPAIVNTQYSLAEGEHSQDIVPTLVFDDGRFTYLRLPGNREMPAVFQVLGDGSEALVNARMEDELLVVDRVSRRLVLRAGTAVVGLWNEAFDLDGIPPEQGTTVPGIRRALKATPSAASASGAPAAPAAPPSRLAGAAP